MNKQLLEELDRIAPIKSFDAFPKIQSTYTSKSRRGGVLTAVVGLIIFLLILNDLGEYLYGAADYTFQVDHDVARNLQLNVDLTIAMPCHYVTIDLRDAVGDRLHLSDAFAKEGTAFVIGKALPMRQSTAASASQMIASSKKRWLRRTAFRATVPKLPDGPACRIFGSVDVKKVTGNLHITTLGHGYISHDHTDHALMNLTHVIHELSFGEYFPSIAQPLDLSYERTDQPFTIFQYFIRVVPTTYIRGRKRLATSQYAVTDYSRAFEHGHGVPGVFFKYELEGMSLTVRESTTSLYQFLVRLVGVVGGVWTVASFGLRTFNRAQKSLK